MAIFDTEPQLNDINTFLSGLRGVTDELGESASRRWTI